MTDRKPVECWLTDMDGVLVHEGQPVPGAPEFVNRLRKSGKPFLILTNNSIYTARDLQARLARMGFEVPESAIWTSALATAKFLDDQRPDGTAYVIGEAGLTTALHAVGYILTDHEPDYVVLGETRTYSFEAITTGDPPDQRRRPVHRDEPRPDRPVQRGRAAGLWRGGRPDLEGDRRRALLRRQAEPDDDAVGPEHHQRAFRDHGDDRRPDGHRHPLWPRSRAGDDPGAQRHFGARRDRTATRTGRPASSTPSPT